MQTTLNKLLKAEILRHEAETALVAVMCEAHKEHPNLAMLRRYTKKSFDALTALHRAQAGVRRRTMLLLGALAECPEYRPEARPRHTQGAAHDGING
jgi:hypothetical protein